MGHYTEQREQWYKDNEKLGQPQDTKAVMVVLPSLDGIVNVGLGANPSEAREDYLSNIVDLIQELELKEMQVRLGGIELEYTEVKGV